MPGRIGSKRSGTWRKVFRCVECEHKLAFGEKMHSDGCCPYCGNMVTGTVVSCNTISEQDPPSFSLIAWLREYYGW
jgi:DNA polymerase II large subunit